MTQLSLNKIFPPVEGLKQNYNVLLNIKMPIFIKLCITFMDVNHEKKEFISVLV